MPRKKKKDALTGTGKWQSSFTISTLSEPEGGKQWKLTSSRVWGSWIPFCGVFQSGITAVQWAGAPQAVLPLGGELTTIHNMGLHLGAIETLLIFTKHKLPSTTSSLDNCVLSVCLECFLASGLDILGIFWVRYWAGSGNLLIVTAWAMSGQCLKLPLPYSLCGC